MWQESIPKVKSKKKSKHINSESSLRDTKNNDNPYEGDMIK